MISLELHEAQLFRVLRLFFGSEQVIPNMSLMAICGGQLPPSANLCYQNSLNSSIDDWAKNQKCLFTVLDQDDAPKIVFEIFSGFENPFEVKDVWAQQSVKPILHLAGIKYLTITTKELSEILDPDGDMDFYQWLKNQMDIE